MLMMANGEKEPRFQIRAGTAGKKNKTYATLNITKDAALEQIEFQKGGSEKDEEDLLEEYAGRLTMPTVAYLRGDGFKDEFQENGLINGFTHEALSNCICRNTRNCGCNNPGIYLPCESLPM